MTTRCTSILVVMMLGLGGILGALPPAAAAQAAESCRAPGATPGATSASAAEGTPDLASISERSVEVSDVAALLWPAGEPGVVLAHGAAYDAASWRPQAEAISAAGATVLALEQVTPDAILAGIAYLRDDCGLSEIALIGASAGGSAAIAAVEREPAAIDRLILLSATGDVSMLGDAPKLFVASEGEGMADSVQRMAEDAPGTENEALLLPGDAHAQAMFRTAEGDRLLQEILDRLES